MEETKPAELTLSPPIEEVKKMRYERFCDIFRRMMVFCLVAIPSLLLISLLGALFLPMVTLIAYIGLLLAMGLLIVFTFGLILFEEYSVLTQMGEILNKLSDVMVLMEWCIKLLDLIPIISIVGIVVAGLQMLFAIIAKNNNIVSRIVISIVSIVVFVLTIILYYAIGALAI